MRALYAGRFQPFHLGHLSVIQEMEKEVDEILILIGSAQENFQPDNPFTASERFEMIESSISEAGISLAKFNIVPAFNIENYALWVQYLSHLLPKFEKVYTGSPVIKTLFLQYSEYEVFDISKNIKVSGTQIRRKILNDDLSWKKDVPLAVSKLIKDCNGVARLKNLGTC